MDMCVVDWGVIGSLLSAMAGFLSAGAVVWVFFRWREQKGAEVVSNEAKEIIYLYKEFESFYDRHRCNINKENISSLTIDYNRIHNEISKKLYFIERSISCQSDKKHLSAFAESIGANSWYRFHKMNEHLESENYREAFKTEINKFSSLGEKYLGIIFDYALYNKKI